MSYPMLARQGERVGVTDWARPVHALLSLNRDGFVVECEQEAAELFGHRTEDVEGQHVSFLMPELARIPLLKDGGINPRLAFLCHCGKHFSGRHRDGRIFDVELFVNRVEAAPHHPLLLMVRAPGTPSLQCAAGDDSGIFMGG